MPIELKDIVGWGVTGGLGVVSLWLNIQTRLDAKRTAQKQKEKNWSLHQDEYIAPGVTGILLCVRLEEPSENRFRLTSIKAQLPRKALLSETKQVIDKSGRHIGLEPIEWKPVLEPNIELLPDGRYVVDRATHYFLLKPVSVSAGRTLADRVQIALEAEEISSRRSVVQMSMKSEPIKWPSGMMNAN